ncbi:MAG: chorismate synthase [Salinivirgaceae bacterium]|jgi:chorismate synthase|nr:chorismate synthase [Bacteroidales bacterium]
MNTFGQLFRISIFGESHGDVVGVTIDGVKPGMQLALNDFEADILRRKSGAKGTTPRIEDDKPQIISGLFNGFTTGAPLTIVFENKNAQSADYEYIRNTPRPSHADFVALKKFQGFNDYRGGGHFSGRLTLALVAAGVIAKKQIGDINIEAKLLSVGGSTDIEATIEQAIAANDSIGGIVECNATNIPIGLGEPFFNSVESVISHLVFSIPAVKGIEFGAGFAAAAMKGSQHNDPLIDISGKTETNHSGGISGGITNGNDLIFRVAVKPTPSIGKEQLTINMKTGKRESLKIGGRYDACIALRMPVIIEAITAIALCDLITIND